MRARNIKPAFFTDEDLVQCSPLARLLFIGLWCYADRCGRFEDRPMQIKISLLPCENCDIVALMDELEKCKKIERYEVNGKKYAHVCNFLKHQTPHGKENESKLPEKPVLAPGKTCANPNLGECSPQPRQVPTRPDSLIPDSLIPDSLIPDSLIPDSLIPGTDKPDPLKNASAASRLARKYQKDVGGKGALTNGLTAIRAIFDANPRITESDLDKAIENYRIACERNGTARDYRLGVGKFFSEEWSLHLGTPDEPERRCMTEAELIEHVRKERERNERLAS